MVLKILCTPGTLNCLAINNSQLNAYVDFQFINSSIVTMVVNNTTVVSKRLSILNSSNRRNTQAEITQPFAHKVPMK
jgi:hypothetical protein